MSDSVVSIGVDLGGTKIEAAVLRRPRSRRTANDAAARAEKSAGAVEDPAFEVLVRERVPTRRERGYEAIVETTAELIAEVARRAHLDLATTRVGVGMPGAISARAGGDAVVKNSNTVCLNGRTFPRDLMNQVGRSIAFANDANCFALAEAHLGAARRYVDGLVFGVIMGSGVGGGIVFRGEAWGGPQSIAGEWGHHAVGPWGDRDALDERDARDTRTERAKPLSARPVCYCGKKGCLELYLSGIAVEHDYARRSGTARKLDEIARREREDEDARAALDELLEAFGRGLANLIDILDPSAVVLGGGVSNLDVLYSEGVERVAKYVFNDELKTPILRHQLGDSAGVLGAALLDDG